MDKVESILKRTFFGLWGACFVWLAVNELSADDDALDPVQSPFSSYEVDYSLNDQPVSTKPESGQAFSQVPNLQCILNAAAREERGEESDLRLGVNGCAMTPVTWVRPVSNETRDIFLNSRSSQPK